MKRIVIFAVILTSTGINGFAQSEKKKVETETIHVSGVCDDCKERIENAAYISGVKRADWDKHTHELTVSFKTDKVTLQQIEQSIANAGHDAGQIRATDSAYKKLPSCCAYKDQATTH
ncbi:MAG TPA: heavy-metal-associated domain-containing protein [Edaphocola sp.]|nr:heavy-metal-associated domain-containing protein [Edaphocola sp.]